LTCQAPKTNIRRNRFAMQSASAIRSQIENALAKRIPSALTPAPKVIRPVAPTGVPSVDDLLDGGLPVGAITEMTGPESSGRTSLALSFLAQITRTGSVCAWIDVCNALHPESVSAAGIDLTRLLWVRCSVLAENRQFSEYQFALPDKYLVPTPAKKGLHGGGFGPHPRNEIKGLSSAVSDWLKPEAIGPRCAEPQPRRKPERRSFELNLPTHIRKAKTSNRSGKPWSRIEQALSAADLLLQGGGFSAIVLDMAGVAPEYVSRVQLSIWFRYRAAAERTQVSILLLTQHPCAKSAGELLLRFRHGNARTDEATVFTGIEHCLEVERRRFAPTPTNVIPMWKPPQRESFAQWRSQSIWAGAR
jgi:recombination protein RecA